MSGIEFLEQAMDIFPRARRALLTAYADTDAAISAINLVDVDHYLLKPWDPPEEKLFPVVDLMIDAYANEPDIQSDETKVIGHRWSPQSFEIRDFLARNAVPYRWFGADEPAGQRFLEAAELGPDKLPVVITADGQILVAPTPADIAETVGLVTSAATDFYDLVVVGGGPGRSRRGRVWSLGGSAYGDHRAAGDRWAGRSVVADRELPRLP